jgi:hypothetical protein
MSINGEGSLGDRQCEELMRTCCRKKLKSARTVSSWRFEFEQSSFPGYGTLKPVDGAN